MEIIERLNPDFKFKDARGSLTQLIHEGYEQVNVLVSKKGTERGGHYHKKTREVFYVVSGKVTLLAYEGPDTDRQTFHEGEMFLIKPMVAHTMYFPEDCVLVALYDHPVQQEDGSMDTLPYIIQTGVLNE